MAYRHFHYPIAANQPCFRPLAVGYYSFGSKNTASDALSWPPDQLAKMFFDKLRSGVYLWAFSVWVGPQLFRIWTEEKPADSKASVSCWTVRGVS